MARLKTLYVFFRIFRILCFTAIFLSKIFLKLVTLFAYYAVYQSILFPIYWIQFRISLARHRVPRDIASEISSMYLKKLRSSYIFKLIPNIIKKLKIFTTTT